MQTLGDILREEREKKGFSYKDIEKETSIRALYIQAIEEGNYGVLPGEVYLKGFIRNYATFLGLDGHKLIDMYRQSQAPQQPAPVVAEPPKPEKKPAPAPDASEASTAESSGGSSSKWLIAGIIALVLAGVAWGVMTFLDQPAPTPKQPTPQAPVQPKPAPAPATPNTPAAPAPAAKPVVILAKYTAPSWTQVIADDKEVFEGIPKAGDTHTWSAERAITIKLGNAAGVNITYNNQPQAKLGDDGEVIIKTYTANTTPTQKP